MSKLARPFGYFWVKYDGDWYIGSYDGNDIWWVCGFPDKFQESELDFIDELIIPKHT